MKKLLILAAVLACSLGTGKLSADTWNKKTKITFSAPFQVPAPSSKAGVLAMSPGTYVFRLDDSQANRHIVQVTNERENKIYTTILAIPDYRLNASSKTVMYFTERKSGAPQAIKSWFYPGDNFGHRFVYPKVQAQQIAAEVKQPVPSHTVEVVEVEKIKVVEVPVYIQTPAKQETTYTAQAFEKHDTADTAGEMGEPVKAAAAPAAAPKELPKTASPVYTLGLLGLMLLAVSLLVRRAAAQLR
jgi:LPXTG-motif cell wall-anchored protein